MSVNPKWELFHSIKAGDWTEALSNLNASPLSYHSTQYVDNCGWYPLHWACCHDDTPTEIVRLLLKACPHAAHVPDEDGDTPLHIAIRDASDEVITMLIRACPDAVSTRNRWGYTPLHTACSWDGSTVVIESLLETSCDAIAFRDSLGRSPLTCFFENWNMRLREVWRRYPPPEEEEKMTTLVVGEDNDVLLNLVVDDEMKVKDICDQTSLLLKAAIHLTIKEDPSSLPNNQIWLPLHTALGVKSCPWAFFQLFLQTQSTELFKEDANGNFPLHIAVMSSFIESFSDGQLYKCFRCKSKIGDGGSIDDDPWYHHENESYCRRCFDGGEDFDFFADEKEFMFVHPVRKNITAIQTIVAIQPQSASIPNRNSKLPLILTIEHGKLMTEKDTDILETIFHAAPMAIATRDVMTHMLPFMMAASVSSTSGRSNKKNDFLRNEFLNQFGLVFGLLMKDPTLVSSGIPRKGSKRRGNTAAD